MVANLHKEQEGDDSLKAYCEKEFDESDDKKKELELSISDSETAIEEMEGAINTFAEEIAALKDAIKALDKSVAEATEMRKAENEEYKTLMANDAQAKEVLLWAKNRLNKFYNPKLYKPPPKRVLSAEDRIVVDMGGTLAPTAAPGGIAGTGIAMLAQVSTHVQRKAALGEAPAAPGAHVKQDSAGVIAMIDLLIKDLDKQMTESETAEKEAQKDYEALMKDSAASRTLDSYALTDKTSTKASLEGDLEAQTESKASATKELMATLEYIASLHSECDWLLKYFDVRKEARDGEIDALKKAKDVLSGADYSLLQRSALRGSRAK